MLFYYFFKTCVKSCFFGGRRPALFQHCSTNSQSIGLVQSFGGILTAILSLYLFIIVGLAILKRSTKYRIIKSAVQSAYCMATSMAAIILLLAINLNMNITFYMLVPILQLQTFALIFLDHVSNRRRA